MSTIDHKAEAVDMLTGANPHGSPTEALAHATLYAAEQTAALVEQTRIQAGAIAAISIALQVGMTNAQRAEFNKAVQS